LEKVPELRPSDGRRARGLRSRTAILKLSVQIASREGLEGLTIGGLARKLGVPKSSVFALFGSKEELQLATLAEARRILIAQVVSPAMPAAEGAERLTALGDAWCDYLTADVFAGGCFLCAASAEMDGRPGPLRDAIAAVMSEWLAVLRANINAAVSSGEFDAAVDASAMAFRLNALGMAANWQYQLFKEKAGVAHARSAWRGEIAGASAPPPEREIQGPVAPSCVESEQSAVTELQGGDA
jgi:AcrR family transcriptional regulator